MNIRNGLLAALVVLVIGVSVVSPQTPNATVQAAESALGAGNLTAVKVTGAGSSAMIGQGLAAGVPAKWVLADYVAEFDFANPGLRITLERTLLDGGVPFGGNRQVWLLSGDVVA